VGMWGCENLKIWGFGDVKIWGCENLKMMELIRLLNF
jgi:hypothetical protein